MRLSGHERKHTVRLDPQEYHRLGNLLRHFLGDLPATVLAVLSRYEVLDNLTWRFGVPFDHLPNAGPTAKRTRPGWQLP